jgi:hypothetical protein
VCTPLYSNIDTLDFATKLAIGIAKKTQIPTYVSCSLSLSAAGVGGEVKEQLEALEKINNVVHAVVKACAKQLE